MRLSHSFNFVLLNKDLQSKQMLRKWPFVIYIEKKMSLATIRSLLCDSLIVGIIGVLK